MPESRPKMPKPVINNIGCVGDRGCVCPLFRHARPFFGHGTVCTPHGIETPSCLLSVAKQSSVGEQVADQRERQTPNPKPQIPIKSPSEKLQKLAGINPNQSRKLPQRTHKEHK